MYRLRSVTPVRLKEGKRERGHDGRENESVLFHVVPFVSSCSSWEALTTEILQQQQVFSHSSLGLFLNSLPLSCLSPSFLSLSAANLPTFSDSYAQRSSCNKQHRLHKCATLLIWSHCFLDGFFDYYEILKFLMLHACNIDTFIVFNMDILVLQLCMACLQCKQIY